MNIYEFIFWTITVSLSITLSIIGYNYFGKIGFLAGGLVGIVTCFLGIYFLGLFSKPIPRKNGGRKSKG